MKKFFNLIFQLIIDVGFGLGVLYCLNTFFSGLNSNIVIVISLFVTAVIAERVEMRRKE